ncbi:LTA synthase family protein [Sphingobacterium daejeonense]|uniref:LTA synthase family protein n=1 Tax=Sphingobacterium daejeonense TaxID=371142 RepID=UPI0021A2A267|nr:LTA synthase family protein [Sphingobacterium daejeonense]MCT1532984.1 LTA synthase family protein [Sphingobacterium daejeonense]
MKTVVKDLRGFFLYFAFWLLMSFIDRFIFLISFSDKVNFSNLKDVLRIYFHGLPLDFSLVSYICVLPFLSYLVLNYHDNNSLKRKLFKCYNFILIIIFQIITFSNVNIYREWGDKISKRAIDAIAEDAVGAAASAESTPILIPVLGIVLLTAGSYWLFLKIFNHVVFPKKLPVWKLAIHFFVGGFILFGFIRGGFGRAPLNPSKAYFSSNTFYNHAAVNTHYSLMREYFTRNQRMRSPYKYFATDAEAKELLKSAFIENPDSSYNILKTTRPNVVVLVLESFVGDLIESMGGEKGITPHFEEMIQEGVFFDQIYSASDRSDKGLVGLFSGFPAQGPESIIKYIDKHENMPAIGQEFFKAGYKTSFYHGGQSEFYNMKSYMLTHGVEHVVDIMNFNPLLPKTSWGIYDHIVLERMLEDLDKVEGPFFSSMFTLVNHEPFELKEYKFGKDNNVNKFKSTAFYTDQSIHDFIEIAKTKAWYKNTLFILVADHGHRLPAEKWDINMPQRFHIPLLFFGDVIKEEYRGKKVHLIGNQTDLAKTLLKQLNLPSDRYIWSRDLFNHSMPEVAFYNSKDAFGIVTPEEVISYDRVGNRVNFVSNEKYPQAKADSLLNIAKAYYQEVYEDFMKY